ncbi:MAG TPA: hypothetical protein VMH90_03915 [Thermoplasmata archaeon]|nr:hypothetical protein [Thermoplasmata archaeon]
MGARGPGRSPLRRGGRRGSGRARIVARVGTIAAILSLLTATLATAGALSPPFRGAYWSAFSTRDASGCSAGASLKSHWSKLTGVGTMFVTGHAKSCRGPSKVFGSSSTTGSEIQVSVPLHPGRNPSGVNVSWSIVATLTTTGGVLGIPTCAPTRSNVSYNLGYTWENYSSIAFACYGIGSVTIGGNAYLEDLTTGTQSEANNSWTGVTNLSGVETYSFADRYNYSNASYWGYNSSYSFSQNHTYGPLGLLVGRWSPTWFLNSSFTPTDRYIVVSTISITVNAQAFGYPKAFGTGVGDLRNGPNQADLTKVVVW